MSQWFAAINRRAFTVEPVDWMYALAFGEWPQGPYENQETGAGLLAALESGGLADPALSAKNQAYLADNVRGWEERFRNTDDAVVYQPVWLVNALLQAGYADSRWIRRTPACRWNGCCCNPCRTAPACAITTSAGCGWPRRAIGRRACLRTPRRCGWRGGRWRTWRRRAACCMPCPAWRAPCRSRAPHRLGSCLLYGDSGLPTQDRPAGAG